MRSSRFMWELTLRTLQDSFKQLVTLHHLRLLSSRSTSRNSAAFLLTMHEPEHHNDGNKVVNMMTANIDTGDHLAPVSMDQALLQALTCELEQQRSYDNNSNEEKNHLASLLRLNVYFCSRTHPIEAYIPPTATACFRQPVKNDDENDVKDGVKNEDKDKYNNNKNTKTATALDRDLDLGAWETLPQSLTGWAVAALQLLQKHFPHRATRWEAVQAECLDIILTNMTPNGGGGIVDVGHAGVKRQVEEMEDGVEKKKKEEKGKERENGIDVAVQTDAWNGKGADDAAAAVAAAATATAGGLKEELAKERKRSDKLLSRNIELREAVEYLKLSLTKDAKTI